MHCGLWSAQRALWHIGSSVQTRQFFFVSDDAAKQFFDRFEFSGNGNFFHNPDP